MRSYCTPIKAIAVLILLTSCTSVPLSSLPALSRIDFQTTRMEDLRVALELPKVIRPKERGVMLDVAASLGSAQEKMQFRLIPADGPKEPQGLISASSRDRAVYTFKLTAQDVDTLNQTRARILDAKQNGDKGELSLGIAAKEFCRVSALPEGTIAATTYIATTETNGYIPVIRNYDLRDDKTVAASLSNLIDCT